MTIDLRKPLQSRHCQRQIPVGRRKSRQEISRNIRQSAAAITSTETQQRLLPLALSPTIL